MKKEDVIKNRDRSISGLDAMPPRQLALDLPQGLRAALGGNEAARSYYSGLDAGAREQVIAYIQSTDTGEEAKARTKRAVEGLEKKDISFLG